jgi:ATP-dependent DNA helicase RecG
MLMPMPPLTLTTPLAELRGVGPERAAQLARLKLATAGDLLWHRPRRYEDRRQIVRIADLEQGQAATVRGHITALGVKRFRGGARSVFEFVLEDGSARLHCRWWNLPFMQNYFRQGDEVFAFGKLVSLKPRTMDHPETEVIEAGDDNSPHLNRISPVYPLTEGLPQRWLRGMIWRTIEVLAPLVIEPWPGLDLHDLPTRVLAVRQIHFPDEWDQIEPARRRLALDEFLDLQVSLQTRRRRLFANARALPCRGTNRLIKPFLGRLGYALTQAQTRVLKTLRQDLGGAHPMRRLIQGDVGSGKTVVAACSGLMALESGYNVALMAPTEILAEQHYRTFRAWFEPLGVPVAMQTGARKRPPDAGPASTSRTARAGYPAAAPKPFLVVGTHALLESTVTLPKLGLVIIDEQHKFGVTQRETLLRKGRYPHLLVMTATPIPRTLGLTFYGDLDLSVIDELPGGRGPVRTFVRSPEALPKVLEFVRRKLAEGRQAYVVYPRVEEANPPELKAVTRELASLQRALAPFPVGLLHGRLGSEEKERVMQAFRDGQIKVLLATTVIEVGLDVANATLMIIENADQYGLAQLHQLRGRIGRGRHEADCILVANPKTEQAKKRLAILAETHDGFRIAEEDLALRGPGEFLGQQQSGLPPFRFGDLLRDEALIARAKALAGHWLDRVGQGYRPDRGENRKKI